MMTRKAPADADVRERIRKGRSHNLIVDAGAGTGKTQLMVDRVLELIAPEDPRAVPIPLNRLAVITFTRKAAGELRFRIRAAMLNRLGDSECLERRRSLLAAALEQIDTAFMGTIHSFADRLLRMRPIEAQLSPQYQLVEDIGGLAEETFRVLLHTSEAGTLEDEATGDRKLVAETQQTIRDFCRAGLRVVTRDGDPWRSPAGLDKFVRRLLENRDVLPITGPVRIPELEAVKNGIRQHIESVRGLKGGVYGHQWLRWRADDLAQALGTDDPVEVLAAVQACLGRKPTDYVGKKVEFGNDETAWSIWNEFWGGKESELDAGMGTLVRPLHDWMGARLAHAAPIIVALYERVKARHEVIDFLDVLIKLRDVLRQSETHAYYSRLFDHILVDEFQDTDPLQAEILFCLTSPGEPLADWRRCQPAPGRLTIVGDPKQSIYRFRRADILTYDEVCRLIPDARREKLATNFRSTPALIDFFNEQLGQLLGRHDDAAFDRETGQAFYQDLSSVFADGPAQAVHVMQCPDKTRETEAICLARHVRWLKGSSGLEVRDALTNESRPVMYGDVAVLARSTFHLSLLFRAFEQYGIPYIVRGGRLFLEEPVVQRFILGLRAIADRHDGVAQAALYRPPFFALDAGNVAMKRHQAADETINELRKLRFSRPPVATAMDLLNLTGLGRFLAVSPNGEQKLDAIRHLINRLDVLARSESLHFDAVTERLRKWIDEPIQMDAPAPIDRDAVQILTIHQAKGLEFPVTAIWDGSDAAEDRTRTEAWACSRDGRDWAIGLQSFRAASPGSDLLQREAAWCNAERLRLYYVAATRARDLLIVPSPQLGPRTDPLKFMCGRILNGAGDALVQRHSPMDVPGIEPVDAYPTLKPEDPTAGLQLQERWDRAATQACIGRAVPAAFTDVAHADKTAAAQHLEPVAERVEHSRHGPIFGSTVHRALARLLAGDTGHPSSVVYRAAIVEGLPDELRDEATQDVERALAALRAEGLLDAHVARVVEYPLLLADNGRLLTGYADFVARRGAQVWLIDFKTDPPGTLADYPHYAEQVKLYARALAQAGVAGIDMIRAGLLFTADGGIRWASL